MTSPAEDREPLDLPEISDEYMTDLLSRARPYTLVLLAATPKRAEPGADAIVREHGRRNMALRAAGLLNVVCPVTDDSDLAGLGLFRGTPQEVDRIMRGDPAVQAGLFTYRIHPVRSFPGDALPAGD